MNKRLIFAPLTAGRARTLNASGLARGSNLARASARRRALDVSG